MNRRSANAREPGTRITARNQSPAVARLITLALVGEDAGDQRCRERHDHGQTETDPDRQPDRLAPTPQQRRVRPCPAPLRRASGPESPSASSVSARNRNMVMVIECAASVASSTRAAIDVAPVNTTASSRPAASGTGRPRAAVPSPPTGGGESRRRAQVRPSEATECQSGDHLRDHGRPRGSGNSEVETERPRRLRPPR